MGSVVSNMGEHSNMRIAFFLIVVATINFTSARPKRRNDELMFNPSMVRQDGPLNMEALNMLHADAVKYGQGAKTCPKMVQELKMEVVLELLKVHLLMLVRKLLLKKERVKEKEKERLQRKVMQRLQKKVMLREMPKKAKEMPMRAKEMPRKVKEMPRRAKEMPRKVKEMPRKA